MSIPIKYKQAQAEMMMSSLKLILVGTFFYDISGNSVVFDASSALSIPKGP